MNFDRIFDIVYTVYNMTVTVNSKKKIWLHNCLVSDYHSTEYGPIFFYKVNNYCLLNMFRNTWQSPLRGTEKQTQTIQTLIG